MGTVHRLGPPLPELARSAVVTFLDRPGRKAKPVDEMGAQAARIELVDVNGKTLTRDVSVSEAHAYLASVTELSGRVEGARAQRAVDVATEEARGPVRSDLQSTLVSTCPHDGDRRRHVGRVSLLTSPTPHGISVQHGIGWSTGAATFEQYQCPTCGSVELFHPGPLTHPAGPPT